MVNSYRISIPLVQVMRITSVIICLQLLVLSLIHAHESYAQTISIKAERVNVQEIFKQIEKQTKISFYYTESIVQDIQPLTLNLKNKSLAETLAILGKEASLNFRQAGNIIAVTKAPKQQPKPKAGFAEPELPPQPKTISGTVTDSTGTPLAGVTVRIKGTNQATATDRSGKFTLTSVPSASTLTFTLIGYHSSEVNSADESTFTIVLKTASALLEEAVAKGYYTTSKLLNTGSVSSVSGEVIHNQPVSDPLMTLQGQIPGLYISQISGVPGSESRVRLRGQNSIANGNNPLYIVDGVPYDSQTLSRQWGASGPISPFALLRNNDIERIDVLKDADATSIYGSRGANGVILITTRKGKEGKTQVDFNIYQAASKVANKLDLMDTRQYLDMRRRAFENNGIQPGPTHYDVNGTWDQDRYTDWQEVMIGGTGHVTDAQLSFSGGSDQTQFLASTGYRRETTIFPGDFRTARKSARLNLNHRSQDQRFAVAFNANYLNYDSQLPIANFVQFIFLSPNAPRLYNDEGNLNWENSTWSNPFGELEKLAANISENMMTNADLDYQVIKGLRIKGNFSFNTINSDDKNITPFTAYNPSTANPADRRILQYGKSKRETWIAEPQLSYEKEMRGHHLDVLVGASLQQSKQVGMSQQASGFATDALIENLGSASTISSSSNTEILYRYSAAFARIGYHYQNRYSLNITGRRDGSSRFGPGRKFGNFGAIGAAWIFSQENFVQNALPFLSYGKLRSSIGSTGNDQLTDYQYLDTYSSNSVAYLGVNGLRPTQLTNPFYGWETIRKIEAAIELGGWDDKLMFNVSWYRNRTGNQLVGYPLPSYTGFTSVQANLPAVIENRGWEFDLTSSNISSPSFQWTTSLNISFPRNKLISYPDLANSSYATSYAIGQPLGVSFLYQFTGIDTETKTYTFKDLDGDGNITAARDRLPNFLGQRYFGGINNTWTYQGLQLNVFFQFVQQASYNFIYNISPGLSGRNQPSALLSLWQQQPDYLQMVSTSNNTTDYLTSNARVKDASFIRLKNASISYKLPKRGSERTLISSARLYLQAQNLFTITKYEGVDPETLVGSGTSVPNSPPLRTIALGLQISL